MVAKSGKMAGRVLTLLAMFVAFSCAMAQDKTAPPPDGQPTCILKEARIEGSVQDTLGSFKAVFDVTATAKGWQSFTLFSTDFAITGFDVKDGDSRNVRLARQDGKYVLMICKEDDYRFEISFMRGVKDDGGTKVLALPLMPAVKNSIKLTVPGNDLRVSTVPEMDFGTSVTKDGRTEISVYGGSGDEVTLKWQPKNIEKAAATVFCETKTMVMLSKGMLKMDSTLDYEIVKGALAELNVEIEDGLNIVNVAGDKIKNWNIVVVAGKRIIKVVLLSEVTGAYQLRLGAEKAVETVPVALKIPRMQASGIERDKGYVAVAAKRGLKVETLSVTGASQIDIGELPPGIAVPEELHLSFRHLTGSFEIALNLSEVKPRVTVDVFSLARVGKDMLRISTKLLYKVRDAGVFQLRLKLGDGLKAVDVTGRDVNNWQQNGELLTVDLRSKAEGEYELNVEMEKEMKQADLAVIPSVEVMDVEREWGYIALASLPGIRLEVATQDGVRQLNVKDIGPAFAVKDGETVDFAFRYLRHPLKLAVNVAEVTPEVSADVLTRVTLNERELALEVMVEYSIQRAGIFSLKLGVPSFAKIVAVEGRDIDDWKYDEKAQTLSVALKAKTQGAYQLLIRAESPVTDITKPVIVPSVEVIGAKKARGFIAVKPGTGLRVKTDPTGTTGVIEIDTKDLPAAILGNSGAVEGVSLAYKYYEQPFRVLLAAEKIKSYITTEAFNLISIGEGVLTVSALVRYDILYAAIGEFKVQLPPGAKNVNIVGPEIRHKEEDKKADGSVWKIYLHAPKQGRFELSLTFELELAKDKAKVQYSGVKAVEVDRETGYLAVAALPDIELNEPNVTDMTPIDEREIPPDYKGGVTTPILMAFRYVRHPFSFEISASTHEFAKVLVAVIDTCRLSTTVNEKGNMITDLLCRIRNTREQYLRLELPGDADIWHVFVAGVQETPLKTTVDGKKVTLIPIARKARAEDAFEVRIRYGMKVSEMGMMGSIALNCPKMNLPVIRLGWSISLPDGHELVNFSGNMQKVESFESQLSQLNPESPLAVQQMPGGQGNPQMRTGGGSSIYTGDKPQTSNTYLFQTLIPLDEAGQVRIQYIKEEGGWVLKGVIALLAMALVVLFVRKAKVADVWKFGAILGVVLVLAGIQMLIGEAYHDYIATLIWSLLGTTVIAGIITLILHSGMIKTGSSRSSARKQEAVLVIPEPDKDDKPAEPRQ